MSAQGLKITRRVAVVAACVLLAAPAALAHRSQTVLSTILWNSATSTLEVTHRFHTADAEAWLGQRDAGGSADITLARNQAQLMLYVEGHFHLTDAAKTIGLEPLGAQIEGEAILLYQHCRLADPPKDLAIDNRIFRDVFEAQTNLVNVRLAQRTRTLIFTGQDGVKKAEGLL